MGTLLLQGGKRKWIRRKKRTARIRSTCNLLCFITVARDLQRQSAASQDHEESKMWCIRLLPIPLQAQGFGKLPHYQ